jgi:hypothetical protein
MMPRVKSVGYVYNLEALFACKAVSNVWLTRYGSFAKETAIVSRALYRAAPNTRVPVVYFMMVKYLCWPTFEMRGMNSDREHFAMTLLCGAETSNLLCVNERLRTCHGLASQSRGNVLGVVQITRAKHKAASITQDAAIPTRRHSDNYLFVLAYLQAIQTDEPEALVVAVLASEALLDEAKE